MLLILSSCIQAEKQGPYRAKLRDCGVYVVGTIKAQTSVVGSKILIRDTYWNKLNTEAQYVTVLREVLHCERGYPYLEGISLMNRKITMAMTAYQYGVK